MYVAKKWWHNDVQTGKVVCTLCPRHCKIPKGKRGFCFVRANVDDQLVLTTWGRSSGFCIDPIEKKPLSHFLPGTPVLSLGTAGCNLGCKFCQNWDISKSREMDTVASIATPEAVVDAAEETGCRSIAFTYNDPVIWAEYAIDIAKVARQRGIKTVAVTAGYIEPDARAEFYDHMDAANIDLKAFTEAFYRKLTQTHLEPVLDTIKYVKRHTNVWFELTDLLIPGENDSEDEIARMCKWLVDEVGDDVPLHFSAFHPDFKMMDKPRTPHATLIRARQQAIDAGVKYAYVGNVYDVGNESTYCHACGKVVIERDWYELGAYDMDGDRCGHCGTSIPGVFEKPSNGRRVPGDWGRKRQRVTIRQEQVHLDEKLTELGFETVGHEEHDDHNNMNDSQPNVNKSVAQPRASARGSNDDSPRIDFTGDEAAVIARHALQLVNASVTGASLDSTLPKELADAPAWGMFVTLERGSVLRACRGSWGNVGALGNLLARTATDTATCDARFPAIEPRELGFLSLDVTLMYDPQQVTAQGDARVDAVEVGTHGLVIAHPNGRGLLLPQVATEREWDAPTFLDQLCLKANLPRGTWRDPSAQLMTFRGRVIEQAATTQELRVDVLDNTAWQRLINAADAAMRDEPINDETLNEPALTQVWPHELGVNLRTSSGLSALGAGANQSLLQMTQVAAKSLRQVCERQRGGALDDITELTVLNTPIVLSPQDYPNRCAALGRHAVLARAGGAWTLAWPTSGGGRPDDVVGRALRDVRLDARAWHGSAARSDTPPPRITAFSVHTVRGHSTQPRPRQVDHARYGTRAAARAGTFYPGDAAQMNAEIDAHLATANGNSGIERRSFPAVMLPHAGWRFCGDTLGKTIARVDVPRAVIIIGPKHTPHGPPFSIAPHSHWAIPGANVPIETGVVDRLLELLPALQAEPDAHRMEHGCEVIVPFLHRLNPQVQVVPIVLGRCSYEDTSRIADALATLLNDWPADREPPLLVISSDMNHFAPEPENRRRDMLAIDAARSGNPRDLYDVCVENDISMCGVLPAVTVMQALLKREPKLDVELIDYSNSGAVSGDMSSVVGYAGMTFA